MECLTRKFKVGRSSGSLPYRFQHNRANEPTFYVRHEYILSLPIAICKKAPSYQSPTHLQDVPLSSKPSPNHNRYSTLNIPSAPLIPKSQPSTHSETQNPRSSPTVSNFLRSITPNTINHQP